MIIFRIDPKEPEEHVAEHSLDEYPDYSKRDTAEVGLSWRELGAFTMEVKGLPEPRQERPF